MQAMEKKMDVASLMRFAPSIAKRPNIMESAYELGLTSKATETITLGLVPLVHQFMTTKFQVDNGIGGSTTIVDVHDIEDNYYSPKYGLKGKLDSTVIIRRRDGSKKVS